jgi:hypothetical protein
VTGRSARLLPAAIAQTWGVGYALNNASEWQDVAITACKAALLIVLLDALRLTKNASWFEKHGACVRDCVRARACVAGACARTWLHRPAQRAGWRMHSLTRIDGFPLSLLPPAHRPVDFVSMQAVLFNGAARSWWAQTRTLVKLQSRLTEE